MDKQTKLDKAKKEFASEIKKQNVYVENLKKNKISSSVLEAEVALRNVFGDEIYQLKKVDEKIEGEKDVVKLSEDEVAFDTEVRAICENIIDSEFDNNLGQLLARIGVGEK